MSKRRKTPMRKMMIIWIDCSGSDAVKHDFDDNKEEEDSREIRPSIGNRKV
jgi:hypothetical protein